MPKGGNGNGGGPPGGGGGGNSWPWNPCADKLDILKAQSDMDDLIGKQEHCRMDPELASSCNLQAGDQVRIRRDKNSDSYAIYTITQLFQDGSDDDDIRMALDARQKLDTNDSILDTVELYTQVPRHDLTDSEAESQSEFVERLGDDGSHVGLIAIGPHGGFIEKNTDLQAERVASQLAAKNVSYWRCSGWRSGGGAFDRWHITSTEISRRSFPLLDSVADRGFTYAVSFHGYSGNEVLVGGAAPQTLRESVRDAITAALSGTGINVRLADANDPVNGDSPNNIVNWLTSDGANGVQVEQSFTARDNHWQAIADAVASVYDALL